MKKRKKNIALSINVSNVCNTVPLLLFSCNKVLTKLFVYRKLRKPPQNR